MTATEEIFVAGESSERTGCQRIRLSPEDVEETLRSVPSAAGRGVFRNDIPSSAVWFYRRQQPR